MKALSDAKQVLCRLGFHKFNFVVWLIVITILAVLAFSAAGVLARFSAGSEAAALKARIAFSPATDTEIQRATADACVKRLALTWLSRGDFSGSPRFIRKMDLDDFAAACRKDEEVAAAAAQKQALELGASNTAKQGER
jgi:hypothetical protein